MTNQILPEAVVSTARPIKTVIVTRLLSRPRGASLGDITSVTGWQSHSIRAFLTGLRRKGVSLEREQRKDGATSYRISRARRTAIATAAIDA